MFYSGLRPLVYKKYSGLRPLVYKKYTLKVGGIQEGFLEERIFRILKKLILFFLLGKLSLW